MKLTKPTSALDLYAFVNAMMVSVQIWKQNRNYQETLQLFTDTYHSNLTSEKIVNQAGWAVAKGLMAPRTLSLLRNHFEECWDEFKRLAAQEEQAQTPEMTPEIYLKRFICKELQQIKELNEELPTGPFREMWTEFGCGPITIKAV